MEKYFNVFKVDAFLNLDLHFSLIVLFEILVALYDIFPKQIGYRLQILFEFQLK